MFKKNNVQILATYLSKKILYVYEVTGNHTVLNIIHLYLVFRILIFQPCKPLYDHRNQRFRAYCIDTGLINIYMFQKIKIRRLRKKLMLCLSLKTED